MITAGFFSAASALLIVVRSLRGCAAFGITSFRVLRFRTPPTKHRKAECENILLGFCVSHRGPNSLMAKNAEFGRGPAAVAALLMVNACGIFFSPALAQQSDSKPVVVQPGAPGMPTRTLPSSTKGMLPPASRADVEFMQGMIMHHAQAVEMTAMIPSHTQNKELHTLGARISSSQSSEINFMKRWLAARGESVPEPTPDMPGMNMTHSTMKLMPGMLTPEQMEALRKAKGHEFDHLFLVGMIQHHEGALTMVKDLFNTAGAGQDAEIFNFATDADNTQRAEIRIMQTMLEGNDKEKR